MRMKIFIFFMFTFLYSQLYSQIQITEVYYNTPFNERMKFINGTVDAIKHHRGEFIEIYNYSDKDINLRNWFLKDLVGIFWLPEKVIKSGQFMVVAYSTLPGNTTEFTELFTTTAGKQDQIIYQDKIILRNKREEVSIGYSFDKVTRFFPKNGNDFRWSHSEEPEKNYIHEIWSTPQKFYTVKSLQYTPDGYHPFEGTPNPLSASYTLPIQNYESLVKESYILNYGFLDWYENVHEILARLCNISIQKVDQLPQGTYGTVGKCFIFDTAGNQTTANDCTASNNTNTPISGYTSDEVEEIKSNIFLYPNPTQGQVTIRWEGAALNKIYNLQVYSAGGANVFGFIPSNGINAVSFSLQNQLPGVFVANFTLNTGQVISKNILKW